MALGIPTYDGTLDRQAMQFQTNLFQNLGAQVRQDINTMITTRQMSGLAQGLQNVDTTSPQFGRQLVGLLEQYPLAAQSQLGQAAINQLGAEFRLNQQIAAEDRRFRNQLGAEVAKDWMRNRPFGTPVTTQGVYDIATNKTNPGSDAGGPAVFDPTATLPAPVPIQPGEQPLFGSGDPLDTSPQSQQSVQPSIPSTQPSAASPTDSVGAKIARYRAELEASKTPHHLAENMIETYAKSLALPERQTTPPIVDDPNLGLMERGPDGVWRRAKTEGGDAIRRGSLSSQIRNDIAIKNSNEKALEKAQEELDAMGLGTGVRRMPDGKYRWWRGNTLLDEGMEVSAEKAERWLALNHQVAQLREKVKEQQAKVSGYGEGFVPVSLPAQASSATSVSVPVRVMGVYDPSKASDRYTPAQ